MVANESQARTLVGKVVGDKMQKTVVVVIERSVQHPKYGKILRRKTKLYVHDENEMSKAGNTVRIQECRPISKTKSWKLLEVIS